MENYRTILEQQREALQKDIEESILIIKQMEEETDKIKERKRLSFKELRYIEKKLSKLS